MNNFYIIPNKTFINYGTLLHITCANCKSLEIIKLVAKYCPSFNMITPNFEAPIHMCIMYGSNLDIVKFVI